MTGPETKAAGAAKAGAAKIGAAKAGAAKSDEPIKAILRLKIE